MSSVQSLGRRSVVAVVVLAVLVGWAPAHSRCAPRGPRPRRAPRARLAAANAAPQAMPVPVAVVDQTEVNTWDEFSGRLEAVERGGRALARRRGGQVGALHRGRAGEGTTS